ncbi:MAG: hypothetical protein HC915_01895 [Anaerolineae bacterium]|nr:hypothetical protein [Anaerolineae bacterium]
MSITSTQMLTNPVASLSAEETSQVQANLGLVSVWRMGSWFLAPSTFNAANTTYNFDAIEGTNVYAFFYGAITRPAGSQAGADGTATGAPGTGGAGTATGAAPEDLVDIQVQAQEESGIEAGVILISTGLTLLLAIGAYALWDRRRKRHQHA